MTRLMLTLCLLLSTSLVWAFPNSATIIDTFDRADNADLGTNWTPAINGTDCALKVASNTAQATSTATDCSEYWNAASFGPDVESFVTITTRASGIYKVYCRLQSVGTAGVDGYAAYASDAADLIRLYRIDNNAVTQLATATQVWADGDALGISCVGSTIKVFRKPVAGAWTEVHSVTDATYGAAGNAGLFIRSAAGGAANDFGVATVSATRRPQAPMVFQ